MGLEQYDEWISTDPQDALDRARRKREAEIERAEQISDEIQDGLREDRPPYRYKPQEDEP